MGVVPDGSIMVGGEDGGPWGCRGADAVAEGGVECVDLYFPAWMLSDCGVGGVVVAETLLAFAWRVVFSGDLNGLLRASSSRRRFAGWGADIV